MYTVQKMYDVGKDNEKILMVQMLLYARRHGGFRS